MAEGLRHAGIEVLRVLAAGALGLALAPWMGAPAWAAQPEVRWPAHFEVEARPGNKQTVGEGRFFVPAWQDDRNLVFFDLRGLGTTDSNAGANAGLAYRRLLGESWIVGGYGFFDYYYDDKHDNSFIGGMLGVEAMSAMWDLRVNGHIPESGSQSASRLDRVRLAGQNLVIDDGIEQALYGVDAEVGMRIPLFAPESWFWDTRVFVGGYYFDASHVDEVAGPEGRLELRIHDLPYLPAGSRLTLGGGVQWDEPRGTQGFGQINLRVPLWGYGGVPPKGTTAAGRLSRRMTDPIQRNSDIVTNVGRHGSQAGINPNTGARYQEVWFAEELGDGDGSYRDPEELHDAIDGAGANGIVVALDSNGDIVEGGGQGPELYDGQVLAGGGAQVPVRNSNGRLFEWTAPGGRATLVAGGANVIRSGEDNLITGLDFVGSNEGVSASSPGDLMVVDSHFRDFTIAGIAVSSTGPYTLTAMNNAFEGSNTNVTGVYVRDPSAGTGTAILEDNFFTGFHQGDSRAFQAANTGGLLDVTLHRNEFREIERTGAVLTVDGGLTKASFGSNLYEDVRSPIFAEVSNFGHLDIAVQDDTIRGPSPDSAIHLALMSNGGLDATIAGNTISDHDSAIVVIAPNPGSITAQILDNRLSGNNDPFGHAVDLRLGPSASGSAFTISDNRSEAFGYGVDLIAEDQGDITIIAHRNELTGMSEPGRGINVDIDNSANLTLDFEDNVLRDYLDRGIAVFLKDSGNLNGSFIGNRIEAEDPGSVAISVSAFMSDQMRVNIVDSYVEGYESGISVSSTSNSLLQALVQDNHLVSDFQISGSGIGVGDFETSVYSATVVGNRVEGFLDGIRTSSSFTGGGAESHILDNVVVKQDSAMGVGIHSTFGFANAAAEIRGNRVEGFGVGIDATARLFETDRVELEIDDNEIANASGLGTVGIELGRDEPMESIDDLLSLGVDVTENRVTGFATGLRMDVEDIDSRTDVSIIANRFVSGGLPGSAFGIDIDIRDSNSADTAVTISDNVVSGFNDGVDVFADDAGDTTVTVTGNTVTADSGGPASGNGVDVRVFEAGHSVEIDVSNNTVEDFAGVGIFVQPEGLGLNGSVRVDGNSVDDSGLDGLHLANGVSVGPLPLSVGGNQVTDSGDDGIQINGFVSDFDLDSPPDCSDDDENNVVTGFGGQAANFNGTTGTICVNGAPAP